MSDIKARIRSVNSTKQITKAMQLVAAAKVRRARERVETSRPFFQKMHDTIGSMIQSSQDINHPYLIVRPVQKTAYIVIAADGGLCGGYNGNIMRFAKAQMEEKNDVSLYTVGQRTRDFFTKVGYEIEEAVVHISEAPTYDHARKLGERVLELYLNGSIDEVYICYTEFKSMVSQVPTSLRLLPLETASFENIAGISEEGAVMDFEPSLEAVLEYVVPKYINGMIYKALIESSASEQAARMTAMDNATENAEEIIDTLTLTYNRVRQAAITQEIAEIVGGASAAQA